MKENDDETPDPESLLFTPNDWNDAIHVSMHHPRGHEGASTIALCARWAESADQSPLEWQRQWNKSQGARIEEEHAVQAKAGADKLGHEQQEASSVKRVKVRAAQESTAAVIRATAPPPRRR